MSVSEVFSAQQVALFAQVVMQSLLNNDSKIQELAQKKISQSVVTPATTISLQEDLSEVNQYIDNECYVKLIQDPRLFWLTYCKAIASLQVGTEAFSVSVNGNEVSILGKKYVITRVKQLVEEIREAFTEGFEKKCPVELSVVLSTSALSFFKADSQLLDFVDCQHKHPKGLYTGYIQPVLTILANFCGGFYREASREHLVLRDKAAPAAMEQLPVIYVEWKDSVMNSTSLKPIPNYQGMLGERLYYSWYQNEEQCDFKIITSEGHILKVHSIILYNYGGSIIRQCVLGERNVLSLSKYSQDTVRAFIDFLYLGGEKFVAKMHIERKNSIDLDSLLTLANEYKIETLIDCCENVIPLMSGDIIEELAQQ